MGDRQNRIIETLKNSVLECLQKAAYECEHGRGPGMAGIKDLSHRLGLAPSIVNNIVGILQQEGRVELHGKMQGFGNTQYWKIVAGTSAIHDHDTMVLEYLRRAVKRDEEKGGGAIRGTDEIAAAIRIPTAILSRVLSRLHEDGKVEFLGKIEGCGNVNNWRIADYDAPAPRM
jgi:DNA-binding MarR family transcriptional regulator